MTTVGIVGYSSQEFDESKAQEIISKSYDKLEKEYGDLTIVSGLTNLGIPALAYKEGRKRGYKLVGVACKKAEDYECFDCEDKHIIGSDWGDESEFFLSQLDVLVRIGGGKQSKAETQTAKDQGIKTIEFDL